MMIICMIHLIWSFSCQSPVEFRYAVQFVRGLFIICIIDNSVSKQNENVESERKCLMLQVDLLLNV